MKDISVSIITYNRKDILNRVIKSLERQTYPHEKFEVVVVDDGSTDGTVDYMKGVLDRTTCDIKYIRREENMGTSVVRNVSLENAESPLVLFLEDDTIADERLLEEHVQWHREWPDERVVVVGREVRDERSFATPFGHYVKDTSERFFDSVHRKKGGNDVDLYKGFITFNLSAKKRFIVNNGMFDPEFKYFSEDIELGYRLSKAGLEIKYNEKAVIFNHHPAYLEEYCRRNLNRGYYAVLFTRKHPEAVLASMPAGAIKCRLKDAVYPLLLKAGDTLDRRGIALPRTIYRKILDYYMEKGVRLALEGRPLSWE
ncbi:MAG: glycosyltransferase [Candidatus Omnitrophica bacterium]|nr:glycosyltransferase [Candidatus Omnitrophota bacterium]